MSQAHKTQQKGHGAAQVQKIIKNTNQTGTIQNDKIPKNRILKLLDSFHSSKNSAFPIDSILQLLLIFHLSELF